MKTANKRDAVRQGKFWFRKNISGPDDGAAEDSCCLMSVDEIINGNGSDFKGLVPLVKEYVERNNTDKATQEMIDQYLDMISGRSSGRYKTVALWIRDFVRSHPKYNFDSLVNERINYDLTVQIGKITRGEMVLPELVGDNPDTIQRIKG